MCDNPAGHCGIFMGNSTRLLIWPSISRQSAKRMSPLLSWYALMPPSGARVMTSLPFSHGPWEAMYRSSSPSAASIWQNASWYPRSVALVNQFSTILPIKPLLSLSVSNGFKFSLEFRVILDLFRCPLECRNHVWVNNKRTCGLPGLIKSDLTHVDHVQEHSGIEWLTLGVQGLAGLLSRLLNSLKKDLHFQSTHLF